MSNSTRDEKIERHGRPGTNASMVFLSSLLLLSSILFGACINTLGNEDPIRSHFAFYLGYTSETKDPNALPGKIWSLGFLFPLGGLFGSLFSTYLVERIGRRYSTLFECALIIIGASLRIGSYYTHIALLFVGRFFDGLAASGLMITGVLLMLETLPNHLLPVYKPLIQVGVNVGLMINGIISMNQVQHGNWNFVFCINYGYVIVLIIAVLIVPESPKYIYSKYKDDNKTKKILRKLRGKHYDENELIEIKTSFDKSSSIKNIGIIEFLSNKEFSGAIATCMFMHMSQQFTGINAVLAFGPSLLGSAGIENGDVSVNILLAIGLIAAIIFAPIIERYRRKLLWMISFSGMLISFSLFMIVYHFASTIPKLQIVFLCTFSFSFQISAGSTPWFIIYEKFPPQAWASAQGTCSAVNWLSNTIIFLLFPLLKETISINVIYIFGVIHALVILYSIGLMSETYGLTYQEVLKDYQKRYRQKLYSNKSEKN